MFYPSFQCCKKSSTLRRAPLSDAPTRAQEFRFTLALLCDIDRNVRMLIEDMVGAMEQRPPNAEYLTGVECQDEPPGGTAAKKI